MEETLAQGLVEAMQSGHWAIFAGFCLMVLIGVARAMFKNAIASKWVPLFSQGLGVIAAVSAGLIAGAHWGEAIVAGIVVGATAGGFWSLLGKHLLRKTTKPVSDNSSSLEGKG